MQLLNNKNWSQTVSQITIKNPTTIFSIFSVNSGVVLQENIIETEVENIDTEIDIDIET
jgi:hypothetical protein